MRTPLHFAGTTPLVALLMTFVGCGQSAPAPEPQAHNTTSRPVDRTVQVAKAESQAQRPSDVAPPAAESADANTSDAADNAPTAEAEQHEPARLPNAKRAAPLGEVPEAELTMPLVALTEGHAATCRVKVGDSFPDFALTDVAGHEQTLAKLRGEKLTVVVFWSGKKPTSLEELRDLTPDVDSRFAEQGLAVVAINTLDDPQLASELAKQAEARFPVLSDHSGEVFKLVATERIPRTYLLDAGGKIVWFDLEYSATTRRDLVQAIRYLLAAK